MNRPTSRVTKSALLVVLGLVLSTVGVVGSAVAAPTTRISGQGSSWAGNALDDWKKAVAAQGVNVEYNANGSSTGRTAFAQGTADYAVSEIPYTGDTKDPQDTMQPNFGYAMLPVVAGGTSFMYNLPVGGKRFTGLKLSQAALAKIFSGQVTQWNDPVIAATNPGVALPAQRITVVVRSDGSGATAQFTLWMLRQFPADYAALCAKTGCNPSSATSYFPYQGLSNFTAQAQSIGVTTYTSNTPYTINYDEYSYAVNAGFPVAQIQNAAGFYTTPTASAVAVALTQAKINTDKSSANYLSQDLSAVYPYKDPRTYPISAYSYLFVPTETHGSFSAAKGATMAYFSAFDLCEGQRTMGALGYSPLPMNLVLAGMDQVLRVPGIDASTKDAITKTQQGVAAGSGNPCNNPTFKPGDSPAHNVLIDTAAFPSGCDAACQAPWKGAAASTASGPNTTGNTKVTTTGKSTTGGSTTGGSDTATTDGSTTAATDTTTDASCDADTGVCADASASSDATNASANVNATPLVIAGDRTWGAAQLALLLCILMGVLLVFAPPLVAGVLAVRPRTTPRGSLPQQRATSPASVSGPTSGSAS